MNKTFNDKVYTFFLEGRIGANNSSILQDEILNALKEYDKDTQVILDFDKVDYLSSSGLRMVLKVKQEYPNFSVINTQLEIYNIFEMTGFTSMMEIKKRLREISIDGKELIAEGGVGKVYRLTEDEIVKVFKYDLSMPDIEREINVTKKAFLLGIPTAISYDIVRVKDKYGLVFEMLKNDTICSKIIKNPNDIDKYIDMVADLMKDVHKLKVEANTFPSEEVMALRRLDDAKEYLTDSEYSKLKEMIQNQKVKNCLIHGDFHIKNIMLQEDSPVLIDLETLSIGSPIADYAANFEAYILYQEDEPGNGLSFFGIPDDKLAYFYNKLFDKNFKNSKNKQEIYEKIVLLASINIIHNVVIYENNNDMRRVNNALRHIHELLPKYNDFDIDEEW